MRTALFLLVLGSVIAWPISAYPDTLMLPNLGRPVTGTTVSSKHALDVNIAGGASITVTEQAVAADAGSLPAMTKVAGGYDGTNVRVLKTNASGQLQVGVVSSALPSGAATAAKQPALGTAGSASADVISVQGVASMTALKVDGSGVTQPVSGSVTATQATGSNLHIVQDVPAATTVKQAAITVGTSAVRLTTDAAAPSATRTLLAFQLLSTSTANCFVGSSSVASSGASRGVQMFAGQTFMFNRDAGDYYAICDASSQTIFVTEQE
jgi:hypothetical protein